MLCDECYGNVVKCCDITFVIHVVAMMYQTWLNSTSPWHVNLIAIYCCEFLCRLSATNGGRERATTSSYGLIVVHALWQPSEWGVLPDEHTRTGFMSRWGCLAPICSSFWHLQSNLGTLRRPLLKNVFIPLEMKYVLKIWLLLYTTVRNVICETMIHVTVDYYM